MKKAVGEIVAGYELREFIGKGGFGEIYRAHQVSVSRDVAIKFASAERANDPQFIRLFEFEAHLVARLEHPHIVPLYDYWRQPDGAFLVMRWMGGGSLHTLIHREALPLQTVVRYIEQIAEALSVAHRHGVVHCDLKPANILLDEDRNAYLADFGIARTPLDSNDPNVELKIVGSPGYMSPEQILSKPITPMSDIYSLGVIFYEMLTGMRLYPTHDSVVVMLHRQLNDPIPSLQAVRGDLPKSFDFILERVLNKNRHERYQDVLELARDLRDAYGEVDVEQKRIVSAHFAAGERTLIFDTSSVLNAAKTGFIANPYKGLQAFQEGDAHDFFGREAVVEQILSRLREETDKSICLTVTGSSGSGKSSLVRAGLLPVIRIGGLPGSDQWYITDMTPGEQPFTSLAAALMRIAVVPSADRMARLQENPDDFPAMLRQIMPAGQDARMLLFIDQFEELFALVEDETVRSSFIRCLIAGLNDPDPCLHLIITLRADFYDRPLLYPDLAAYVRGYTEVVVPMSRDELELAVTAPAARVGVSFEPGLVAVILKDIQRQPSALPQLQFMLAELFERRSLLTMSQAAYESIGGVAGSLTRRAEELYTSLSPQHQEVVRELFLRLVAVGDDGTVTRRRVLRSELGSVQIPGEVWDGVIEMCVKHRLLMYDRDVSTRQVTVEVAHEALLHGWERLNAWLESSFDALRVHRQLTAAAFDWQTAHKEESFLPSGARLVRFEEAMQQTLINLNDVEREFVQEALARRERQQLEQQAQQRRELGLQKRARRFLLGLAIVLLLATVVSSLFGVLAANSADAAQQAQGQAEQNARTARSGELAVQALLSVNDGRIDQALLLSLEALNVADTPDARSSLQTALTDQLHLQRYLHLGAPARTVAYSPDGRWLAVGTSDGRVLLYGADAYTVIDTFVHGSALVNAAAFSPEGRFLASAGSDNLIRFWDVEARQPVGAPLAGHTGEIWSLAYSPDGAMLASAGEDLTIRLWNADDGAPVGEPLQGHDDIVFSVDFSPDGAMLASGSADNTIRLWNVESGELFGEPLQGHDNWVLSVAFSPDGAMLASGSADNTIRLWDVETRSPRAAPLQAHEDWVRSVQFSPDGQTLLSGSRDGSIRLWNLASARPTSRLLDAHQDDVYRAVFDPSGEAFASASLDGSVILWSTRPQAIFSSPLYSAPLSDAVQSVAFLDDSMVAASAVGALRWDSQTETLLTDVAFNRTDITTVAVASAQPVLVVGDNFGALQRWSLDDGVMEDPQPAHTSFVLSLGISPQGDMAASSDSEGGLLLTRYRDTVASQSLIGHDEAVYALAFDPTGTRLASGANDGSIILWDTTTGQMIGSPLRGPTSRVWSLAFSHDGRLLASGSGDGTVILWDVETRQQIRQFIPEIGETTTVGFDFMDHHIAIGGMGSVITLYDLATGQRIGQPMAGHGSWVTAMAYGPGDVLVSGSRDGSVIRWSLDTQALRSWACVVANRDFTRAEWEQYFSVQPFRQSCTGSRTQG